MKRRAGRTQHRASEERTPAGAQSAQRHCWECDQRHPGSRRDELPETPQSFLAHFSVLHDQRIGPPAQPSRTETRPCSTPMLLRIAFSGSTSRDGWLILGGFAVKGAWVGEAGWLVASNGTGTTFSACQFAHFLSLFLAGMGTESFCRRYSITAHPTSAETMAIEKFVPVKISLKANIKLFPLPLVLVNSP